MNLDEIIIYNKVDNIDTFFSGMDKLKKGIQKIKEQKATSKMDDLLGKVQKLVRDEREKKKNEQKNLEQILAKKRIKKKKEAKA